MKIVLNNTIIDFDMAMRGLKSRYSSYDECHVKSPVIEENWKKYEPLKFEDIARIENLEVRRSMIGLYGIDRLIKEVNPTLINERVIPKKNIYLDPVTGEEVKKTIEDKYQLWKVDGIKVNLDEDLFYVRCWCTSTGREYLIWVDINDIYSTNHGWAWIPDMTKVSAIDAIAWTFVTNIKPEAIDYICRQGDCLLFKIKEGFVGNHTLPESRHMTGKEYLSKLISES